MNYTNCSFYINYDRYGQFSNHDFVCVADWGSDDDIADALSWIDAGDTDAMDAGRKVKDCIDNNRVYLATGSQPWEAVKAVCDIMDIDIKKGIK